MHSGACKYGSAGRCSVVSQVGNSGQAVLQVIVPARRVVAGAETARRGIVQNVLDAAADLVSGCWRNFPDWLHHLQHQAEGVQLG